MIYHKISEQQTPAKHGCIMEQEKFKKPTIFMGICEMK